MTLVENRYHRLQPSQIRDVVLTRHLGVGCQDDVVAGGIIQDVVGNLIADRLRSLVQGDIQARGEPLELGGPIRERGRRDENDVWPWLVAIDILAMFVMFLDNC